MKVTDYVLPVIVVVALLSSKTSARKRRNNGLGEVSRSMSFASSTTSPTVSSVSADVSTIESILHAIQLIPKIKDGSVTVETIIQKMFKFASDITLESLEKNNITEMESEINAITQVFDKECGGTDGCKVAGNMTVGISTIEGLKDFAEIKTTNLMKMSVIKKIIDSVLPSSASLDELSTLLNFTGYPHANVGKNGVKFSKIQREARIVMTMVEHYKNLTILAQSFSKQGALSELSKLEDLQKNTKSLKAKQPAIDDLNTVTGSINTKVTNLQGFYHRFRQLAEQIAIFDRFDSAAQSGGFAEIAFLESLIENGGSQHAAQLTGAPDGQVKQLLEPLNFLKKELKSWMSYRMALNSQNGFKPSISKVKATLESDQQQLNSFSSVPSLANCTNQFSLSAYVDTNLNSNFITDGIDNVVDMKTVTSNFKVSDNQIAVLRMFDLPDTADMDYAKVISDWKSNSGLSDIKAMLGDFEKATKNFKSIQTDPVFNYMNWVHTTGIVGGYECAKADDKLTKTQKAANDLAQLKVLKSDDPDVKSLIALGKALAVPIKAWKTRAAPKKIPVANMKVPNSADLSTSTDFAKAGRVLRVLAAFETNKKEVQTVIDGIDKIDQEIQALSDSSLKQRLSEMWTDEAKKCLRNTMSAMKAVKSKVKSYRKLSELKPILNELAKTPSCNSGLVLAELGKVVADPTLKASLDAVKNIELNFASAQSYGSTLDKLQAYFENTFGETHRENSPNSSDNAQKEEEKSYFWIYICVAILILVVLAAVLFLCRKQPPVANVSQFVKDKVQRKKPDGKSGPPKETKKDEKNKKHKKKDTSKGSTGKTEDSKGVSSTATSMSKSPAPSASPTPNASNESAPSPAPIAPSGPAPSPAPPSSPAPNASNEPAPSPAPNSPSGPVPSVALPANGADRPGPAPAAKTAQTDKQKRLAELRKHVQEMQAEQDEMAKSRNFRNMGPIFFPRSPKLSKANDPNPKGIVLTEVTYDPTRNERYMIGSDVDDIELDNGITQEPNATISEDSTRPAAGRDSSTVLVLIFERNQNGTHYELNDNGLPSNNSEVGQAYRIRIRRDRHGRLQRDNTHTIVLRVYEDRTWSTHHYAEDGELIEVLNFLS